MLGLECNAWAFDLTVRMLASFAQIKKYNIILHEVSSNLNLFFETIMVSHLNIHFLVYLVFIIYTCSFTLKGASGGGSGGSILLIVDELEGHGDMEAMGGAGGKGGSGGRIAAHVSRAHKYHGEWNAYGGAGSDSTHLSSGGPGSVYIKDHRDNIVYQVLKIDNNKYHWDQYYVIDETDTSCTFDELHILNNATVALPGDGTERKLIAKKVYGDRSGRLHAKQKHTLELERGENQATIMKCPINLWLDDGAKAYLATITYIVGTGDVAFWFNGEIISVMDLRIMPERKVEVGTNAMTSSLVRNVYQPGTPGEFILAAFELGSKCIIDFPPPMGTKFSIVEIVSLFSIQCLIIAF